MQLKCPLSSANIYPRKHHLKLQLGSTLWLGYDKRVLSAYLQKIPVFLKTNIIKNIVLFVFDGQPYEFLHDKNGFNFQIFVNNFKNCVDVKIVIYLISQ